MYGDPVSPPQYFQVNRQTYKMETAAASHTVGTNRTQIAAVTGYIHRIMGWNLQAASSTSFSGFIFKDGNVTTKHLGYAPPCTDGAFFTLDVIDSGYFETTVSTALTVDVTDAGLIANVYYISYKP